MKQLIFIACLGAVLFLQSCGGGLIKNKNKDADQSASRSKVPVPDATDNLVIGNEKDIPGYWVGTFGPETAEGDSLQYDEGDEQEFNTINIAIDSLKGNKVKGHTVIGGKVRFFKCSMKKTGSKYQFSFYGGADEKSAGTYKFSITEGDTLLKGRWDAASDKIPAHSYALTKRLFKYNPDWKLTAGQYVDFSKRKKVTEKTDDGQTYQNEKFFSTSDDLAKYNASAEVLTKQYVANLKKGDLLVLRNSIFARHGYTFKKPLLSLYFSQQPWYVPLNTDVTAELTATEKKNIALLAPYEKNAEEYYGAFGR
ncbi:MAG: YARHG domain-containing protein [Sphingobacteriales bacterium]